MTVAGCLDPAGLDYRKQDGDPELLHVAIKQLTGVMVYIIFSSPQASHSYRVDQRGRLQRAC